MRATSCLVHFVNKHQTLSLFANGNIRKVISYLESVLIDEYNITLYYFNLTHKIIVPKSSPMVNVCIANSILMGKGVIID